MPEPEVGGGRLRIGPLESDCLAEILLPDAPSIRIPVGDDLTGSLEGIAAAQRWTDDEVELTLRLERAEPIDVAVRLGFRLGPVSGSTVARSALCPGSIARRKGLFASLLSTTLFRPTSVFTEYATTVSSGCGWSRVFFTSCPAPACSNSSIP